MMKTPATYTSTIPKDLLHLLNRYSERLAIPKNKIIEKALRNYFDELKRAEYVKSFMRAGGDKEMMSMAEEGLADYLKILDRK